MTYKVGDEVGVVRYNISYGTRVYARFGKVTKINGHGHIFVSTNDDELRFGRNHREYQKTYGTELICPVRLRADIADTKVRMDRNTVVRKIESTLSEGWWGGTWHITTDRVSTLKSLMDQLESMVSE